MWRGVASGVRGVEGCTWWSEVWSVAGGVRGVEGCSCWSERCGGV